MFKILLIVVLAFSAFTGCNKKIAKVETTEASKPSIKFVKIVFHQGSDKLQGEGLFELLTNINLLRTSKLLNYDVCGYACEMPSKKENEKLAISRANAVKKALWNFGINTDNAEVKSIVDDGGVDCGYVQITESK